MSKGGERLVKEAVAAITVPAVVPQAGRDATMEGSVASVRVALLVVFVMARGHWLALAAPLGGEARYVCGRWVLENFFEEYFLGVYGMHAEAGRVIE